MSQHEDKLKALEKAGDIPFVDGKWEAVLLYVDDDKEFFEFRKKVFGGWLYRVNKSITFIPDPYHVWDKWMKLPE